MIILHYHKKTFSGENAKQIKNSHRCKNRSKAKVFPCPAPKLPQRSFFYTYGFFFKGENMNKKIDELGYKVYELRRLQNEIKGLELTIARQKQAIEHLDKAIEILNNGMVDLFEDKAELDYNDLSDEDKYRADEFHEQCIDDMRERQLDNMTNSGWGE